MTEEELLCPWCGSPVEELRLDNLDSSAKIYGCDTCPRVFVGPIDMSRECGNCIHWCICRVVFALRGAQQLITEVLLRELAANCIYWRRKE